MLTTSVTSDLTVSYRRAGQGAPLVFLHAFPLSSEMWEPQIKAFAPDFTVLAPDVRGIGGTSLFQNAPSIQILAQDLAMWLDAISIGEPVMLCGLSMGGYTAFEFARAYPQKLKVLILCDTRPEPDSAEAKKGREEMIPFAQKNDGRAVAQKMLPKLLGQSTLASNSDVPAQVQRIAAPNLGASLAQLAAALRDRRDSTDLLPHIKVPTLIVGGEEDTITTPEIMASMAGEIPQARHVVIERAGHLSNLEQASQFNAVLREFLAEI